MIYSFHNTKYPTSNVIRTVATVVLLCRMTVPAHAVSKDVKSLIESSCISCHDNGTETRLNFKQLDDDLTNPDAFRQWERVFDKINDGEMPPKSEPQPEVGTVKRVLASLKQDLLETSRTTQQGSGRVPSRRLTRLEYEYTVRDLLQIEEDLAGILPAESDSGGFDTLGAAQGFSPLHIRSYLRAADHALDAAIRLGRKPPSGGYTVDYLNSPHVNRWYHIPQPQGGKIIKKLDDSVALFVDLDYIMRSDASGLYILSPGRYRITVEAYAYQAKTPVTLKLILASEKRGGAELLGAFDLLPDQTRTVEVTAFMKPGDYLYPSVADLDPFAGVYSVGDAAKYKGEGVAVRKFHIEGPLLGSWPPESTQQILTGVPLSSDSKKNSAVANLVKAFRLGSDDNPNWQVDLNKEPIEHVTDVVKRLGALAFRRPVEDEELDSFVALAKPAIEEKRDFVDAVRLPLRSMLSSPQFLFFSGEAGELDDYALASRLSYFLWKSMPDAELFARAADGTLSDRDVLAAQVDRMLDTEKSTRFVQDFLGQSLRLYEINATSPDEHLYPEFDDVLNQSIIQETELFFAELVEKDLSASNLADSDFTFLNRRLAEHYGIPGVEGQQFRRVTLPEDSPRGGILTHASILKVTANGTVTSPVTRGNFVLTNFLGTPSDPPLPNVGSIEPDTRGTTTIRETLDAHRNIEACARCHREIDPPGFALESFDPIGGYRTRYRASAGFEVPFQGIVRAKVWKQGPQVDASGVTIDGKRFSGIREFKQHLLEQKEQIARHLISQLIVYSTGAEIQFADREHVEDIVQRMKEMDFPVRSIIHEVVQSPMFKNK